MQVAQILDFSILNRVFQHQWSTLGPGRGATNMGQSSGMQGHRHIELHWLFILLVALWQKIEYNQDAQVY